MAFSSGALKSIARGDTSSQVKTVWLYKSADSLATIKGANYYNSKAAEMTVGDIIFAVGDSVPGLLSVSSNTGTVVGVVESAGAGGGSPGAGSVGTTELADDGVTYAKIQNVSATAKVLGRSTAGAGDVEEIDFTAAMRTVADDASTAAMLVTLGAQPLDASLTAFAALTTAANRYLTFSGADTPVASTINANGISFLAAADYAAMRVALGVSSRSIQLVLDGGGAVIPTGVYGDIQVPYACTVTAWRLLADQSGSMVVDVWKDTYTNYPPTIADTVAGSELPTISAATKGQDTSLSTWTTAVAAGDILRFNVNSCSTITRALLVLEVTI
jgi:hypothetical protein